jgi:hypothetical protein
VVGHSEGEISLHQQKEACCRQHFWWRMTKCMANESINSTRMEIKCDSKIYFEDWETAGVSPWTKTTHSTPSRNVVRTCFGTITMDALDEALPRSNLISALTSRVCQILKTARAQIFLPKSSRLQVPELFNVIGISASLETQNLVLPATITGDLNLQYY